MKTFTELTPKEIIDFLGKVTKDQNCPVCDKDDWLLANSKGQTVGPLSVWEKEAFTIPPPMMPMAVVVCKNCGFTRFHSLAIICNKID